MKKLLILALTLIAVPLLAMGASEESVTMTPEVPTATLEACEAPATTTADPVALLVEDGESQKGLLSCIDTDEPCFSFKDCLGACGGLPCTCLNGTCQYCP